MICRIMKPQTMDNLCRALASVHCLVFLTIFLRMLYNPQGALVDLGSDYDSEGVAGRAERRAYYAGSALCVAWATFPGLDASTNVLGSLLSVRLVIGGFVLGRLVGYLVDGRDQTTTAADAVFILEFVDLLATQVCLLWLRKSGHMMGKDVFGFVEGSAEQAVNNERMKKRGEERREARERKREEGKQKQRKRSKTPPRSKSRSRK